MNSSRPSSGTQRHEKFLGRLEICRVRLRAWNGQRRRRLFSREEARRGVRRLPKKTEVPWVEQEINVYSMQTATTILCLPDSPLSFRFQGLGQGGELNRHAATWHSRSAEGGYDAVFSEN